MGETTIIRQSIPARAANQPCVSSPRPIRCAASYCVSASGYFSRADATGHRESLLKDFDPGYSQTGKLNASPRACAKVILSSLQAQPTAPRSPRMPWPVDAWSTPNENSLFRTLRRLWLGYSPGERVRAAHQSILLDTAACFDVRIKGPPERQK